MHSAGPVLLYGQTDPVRPTVLLRPEQQHRHADIVLHASGGGAEEDVFDEAVAVGAHDHQVSALLLNSLDELRGSVP